MRSVDYSSAEYGMTFSPMTQVRLMEYISSERAYFHHVCFKMPNLWARRLPAPSPQAAFTTGAARAVRTSITPTVLSWMQHWQLSDMTFSPLTIKTHGIYFSLKYLYFTAVCCKMQSLLVRHLPAGPPPCNKWSHQFYMQERAQCWERLAECGTSSSIPRASGPYIAACHLIQSNPLPHGLRLGKPFP